MLRRVSKGRDAAPHHDGARRADGEHEDEYGPVGPRGDLGSERSAGIAWMAEDTEACRPARFGLLSPDPPRSQGAGQPPSRGPPAESVDSPENPRGGKEG